ncbi:hypothetical protein K9M41_03145 [Candidatus Gracilibacteria bacterium]|nr:hypothetical protein [Candidatus Gracilibacteria bacterium]
MNSLFLLGLVGALILVSGAAWPEGKDVNHPAKSVKNWLFALGALFMLTYSLLGYLQGETIFFVLLQSLAVVASILMMLNVRDDIDTPIIAVIGLGLIVYSLYLFEGYQTVFFVLGLSGIGMGYAFQTGTIRRELALTLGSIMVAFFSYLEASMIFMWLNIFFAIFSGYYLTKSINR